LKRPEWDPIAHHVNWNIDANRLWPSRQVAQKANSVSGQLLSAMGHEYDRRMRRASRGSVVFLVALIVSCAGASSDREVERLSSIERRLAAIEARLGIASAAPNLSARAPAASSRPQQPAAPIVDEKGAAGSAAVP